MKKIILGLVVTLALFSCSKSPDEQAKNNIKEYLKTNMDDPSSYENVSFGKLDTLHSSFDESKEGIELRTKDSELSSKLDALSAELDKEDLTMERLNQIQKEDKEITTKRLAINDEQTKKSLNYKGPVNGYAMTHKFRGKNKLGAVILTEKRFLLDTKFNVLGTDE